MRIRALIYLQGELQELEVKLETHNERKQETDEDTTSANSQRILMCTIREKIEQYGKCPIDNPPVALLKIWSSSSTRCFAPSDAKHTRAEASSTARPK